MKAKGSFHEIRRVVKRASRVMRWVRGAMNVRRFHTAETVRENTVGHHSANVAVIASIVYRLLTKRHPSGWMILTALMHDVPERVIGDIPSPTKNMLGRERLEHLEDTVLGGLGIYKLEKPACHDQWDMECWELCLTFADNLDGYMFCRDERLRGNRALRAVEEKYWSYIQKYVAVWGSTVVEMIANYVKEKYDELEP